RSDIYTLSLHGALPIYKDFTTLLTFLVMCKKAKFGKSKVTKSLLLNIQTKTFILLYFSNFHSFSYYFVAQTEEIIAMKMDVVQRGARKKYFWDLHELLPQYPLHLM